MSFFDFFRAPDINAGVQEFRDSEGALLLDVRTGEEYAEGHIPGSRNLPLQYIDRITSVAQDKNTPIFVHCLSGGRSARAASELQRMGYTKVKNIGGIGNYRGEVERG